MPGQHNFEYLALIRTFKGRAGLRGSGDPSPQTIANRNARQTHSATLDAAARTPTISTNHRRV